MTDEMLELARANKVKAGATNVEFLNGTIESIPLPNNSVDVIISNCVINLSSDKDAVLRKAFRVLKSGGRFAVSNVVVRGEVPAAIRRNMVELWVGCIAGVLERHGLRGTNFEPPDSRECHPKRRSTSFEGFRRVMASMPAGSEQLMPIFTLCENVLKTLGQRPGRLYDGKHDDLTPLTPIKGFLRQLAAAKTPLDQKD